MNTGQLHIDLDSITDNWRKLDALSATTVQTAAVVKADAYGLGAEQVAASLASRGVRTFFVAVAKEGVALRNALGPGPVINVFSGHMAGDAEAIRQAKLVPMLNSPDQVERHKLALPGHPFGIQLDSGMNRLGMEAPEWQAVRGDLPNGGPSLIMSHLACADEPDHEMNARQLAAFRQMTDGVDAPRSLSATGGILLGREYHFDLARPGVGLFGGLPFADATPVVTLDLPVIQTRKLEAGEPAGYGNSWTARRPSLLATVSGGYADGILRALSGNFRLFHEDQACPVVGRVSMDLLTVDITDLDSIPDRLSLLNHVQGVDALAESAGTIGYEILTSLGSRYDRHYKVRL